jgi:phage tail sheath gpL-like
MVDDGRGVVSADGADEATAQWSSEGVLEVSVAGDRYRFPARMKDDAPQP